DFAPVIEVLKRRLQYPNDLAVDVVDGGGKKQKPANGPAEIARPLLGDGYRRAVGNGFNWIAGFHESTGAPDPRKALVRAARPPMPRGSTNGIRERRTPDDSRKARERYHGPAPGA